jgi:hypothetical protein
MERTIIRALPLGAKIRPILWRFYEPLVLICVLIAAASGLEQSYRYGRLGELIAGLSYPNCATLDNYGGE